MPAWFATKKVYVMELTFGVVVGVIMGAAVGFLIVVLVYAIKRGTQKNNGNTKIIPMAQTRAIPRRETKVTINNNSDTTTTSPSEMLERETKLIESFTTKENKLGVAITEVKDLVLRVADIVSRTNDASGEAARAFNSAKTNLDSIDLTDSDDLLAAYAILLTEINSVITTNEKLQNELESARGGIAEQRRQIEELRNAVRIDALTQIPNRAAFDERLNEFLRRLDRTDEVFSLLLLDIDFFKKVNDTYGHVNGDRILKGIAKKIKVNIRANDVPARYGGEEFAVILPNTKIDVAQTVAERMRQDIAKTNFKLDEKNIRVTISGGLTEGRKGMNTDEIISLADKALYKSKSGGRNAITLTEPGEKP